VTARTEDYDEIVRVVQLFIDAWNDNDISKLRVAFDEDARIFYIVFEVRQTEVFDRWFRKLRDRQESRSASTGWHSGSPAGTMQARTGISRPP
jgi:hypothetical protein